MSKNLTDSLQKIPEEFQNELLNTFELRNEFLNKLLRNFPNK